MALTHVIEKLSGGSQSLQLPIFVYDNGTPPAAIDEDDVKTYVDAQYGIGIPTSVLGVPDDGDPRFEQLSMSAFRVVINYRAAAVRPLPPPVVGQKRSRFNFVAPRKFIKYAPEVAKFPSSAPTAGGLVNVIQDLESGAFESGLWLDPPPVSFVTDETFAPSTITNTWVRTLAQVIQACAVNSDALVSGAYAAGELMIGYCSGQQISNGAFTIETGWCWQKNVTGESRGSVTEINYDGHDFVWELYDPNINRTAQTYGLQVKAVYVSRVRPRTAFADLGISPP